ncbi:hypothetical protein [Planococcus lenghuensis]|uniref:Uncharacterized protein n=1 Tax=Planococcus lenghuensis TaxID=2213202 RepID=A0A1Q2L0S4_9BACL|nr:hypothetical protein [Planococcus lenghuensis]AQQ54060.1 hypothetical protein B0X71_13760 [Planococcus lenghuensis]
MFIHFAICEQEEVNDVDYLAEMRNLEPENAYVLSSICVDLKISEIIDAGQYVVSAVVPLSVFREQA